mmetsp:Transcript_6861/g.10033  ORF Transcript_6861/g.10033 Transcript_6861/m.10033 type:complete len:190 (-) Transcript_6861:2-571(-)
MSKTYIGTNVRKKMPPRHIIYNRPTFEIEEEDLAVTYTMNFNKFVVEFKELFEGFIPHQQYTGKQLHYIANIYVNIPKEEETIKRSHSRSSFPATYPNHKESTSYQQNLNLNQDEFPSSQFFEEQHEKRVHAQFHLAYKYAMFRDRNMSNALITCVNYLEGTTTQDQVVSSKKFTMDHFEKYVYKALSN